MNCFWPFHFFHVSIWSQEAQALRSGDIQSAENVFADTTRITDSSVNDSLLLHALQIPKYKIST